jgi:curved DNA-binding protein
MKPMAATAVAKNWPACMRRCVTYGPNRGQPRVESTAERRHFRCHLRSGVIGVEYKDYYKIMGVGRDASADEIKRAYRKLARKFHPDVSKEKNAEERFKEIGEAYEVLRDPEKRAAYDGLGTRRPGEEFRPPPDWRFDYEAEADPGIHSDFFEQLFGGLGGRGRRSSFRSRGLDTTGQIEISLEEAFAGTERRLSLQRVVLDAQGRPQPAARELTVRIPPGAIDGQRIRLPSQGEAGPSGGPAGDLFLEVKLLPHRWFRVEGRDISIDLPVTPWEAALGETVRVPTLGGRVDLKLPKGSQTDRQLRLRGRGLPGSPPGDQFVVLKIMAPAPASPEEEELYKRLAAAFPANPRQAMEGSQ